LIAVHRSAKMSASMPPMQLSPPKRNALAGGSVTVWLWLFQETLKPEKPARSRQRAEESTDFGRIRCPSCKWRPDKFDRWYCADCDYPEYFYDACGTSWNTFTTRGRCPGCGHQWRWTICLRCQGWSRHADWYE
jgi:hypothetical protein